MINFYITDQLSFIKLEIIETLRLVIDPELHINIIDLGLVYRVKVDESEKVIIIDMTLSSRHCPMGESIVSAVKKSVDHHFNDFKTQVNLVWEPVWSYNNITDEGKRLLSQ